MAYPYGDPNHDLSHLGSWRHTVGPGLDLIEDVTESQGEPEDHVDYGHYYDQPGDATLTYDSEAPTESSYTASEALWSVPSPTAYTGTSSYGSAPVFAQDFFAAPPPPPQQHQQTLNPHVFHCEFESCSASPFHGKNEWIDHVIADHFGGVCPPVCSCLFCDKKFDSADTSGGDRRKNFVRRMEHIRKHVERGKAWETRRDDAEMKEHPVRQFAQDPRRPTFYPPAYVTPKQKNKAESALRLVVDQQKEDRRHKKESKSRRDPDKKDKESKKEHKKHSKK